MANSLKRIENFAKSLGANGEELKTITDFAKEMIRDMLEYDMSAKDVSHGDLYTEGWGKQLADSGVNYGNPYIEDATEEEYDRYFADIHDKSARLYGYIMGVLGY